MKPKLKLTIGPVSGVAISANEVFCSHHVGIYYTTATVLNQDGTEFGTGKFIRYNTSKGPSEEKECNFNFSENSIYGDSLIRKTWRALPDDVVVKSFANPKVGDMLLVESNIKKKPITARIKRLGSNFVFTDYVPEPGDSGSLCWSLENEFLGVLSGADIDGSGKWIGSFATTPFDVANPVSTPIKTPDPVTKPDPTPSTDASQGIAELTVVGAQVMGRSVDGVWYCLSSDWKTWTQLPKIPKTA